MTNNINKLNEISFSLRKKIIDISYQTKAHHIGSELSCIDILVALYYEIMNIDPNEPTKKIRDYFKRPRWAALTKKQEERYGRGRQSSF